MSVDLTVHPWGWMVDGDRTVHGILHSGDEIARYARAGKWFLERPWEGKRRRVSMLFAAHEVGNHGTWFEGLPGGRLFDAKVRWIREGAC